MKQYFTYRPLFIMGTLVLPDQVFNQNFPGLNITFTPLGGNNALDGRYLGLWQYDGDLVVAHAIAEAMKPYSYHPKTLEAALEFAKKVGIAHVDASMIAGPDPDWTPGEGETEADRPMISLPDPQIVNNVSEDPALIPILLKALQELADQHDALAASHQALSARLDKIDGGAA